MPILHVNLLGDFRLRYDETLVTTVVQPRMQALLAYLLIHRDSPQSRQQLAFLFWPDTSESQARTNLRQLLHHLHRALPDAHQFLQIQTKSVQWRQESPFTVDIADFISHLDEAVTAIKEGRVATERTELESALKHYRGELLPTCYNDWILPERERLHQAYSKALERLILLEEEQRDYSLAIEYAERLLRHEPLHETTYRRLMSLHALRGDRVSALRVYHACVTVMERELGVEPNQQTQEVYQHLLNTEAPAVMRTYSSSVSKARSAFVGRHGEWKMLLNTWKRAANGHTTFVLITAEAGLGKTRLAEEFVEWASQQGITTARSRSYATAGRLAYAPITELLRTDALRRRLTKLDDVWLTELSRLLPELLVERRDLSKPEPITENWQRKRLFDSLAKAIISDTKPLLLFLDDLQWCDQDTLEWLHYLLYLDEKARLMVVGTMRPEDVDQEHPLTSLVLDLRIREKLTEIELQPLDVDDTKTLAEQMIGRKLDVEQALRLYRRTEGNPFVVVETVRAETSSNEAVGAFGGFERASAPVLTNSTASFLSPSRRTLPPRVHAVVQARLRQLSPSAHELASVAATIGRAFNSEVLAQASEIDEERFVQSLDELWRRRIIREQGRNAYDFSHDYLCEGAYRKTSAARQQVVHRRVASALEQVHAGNLDAVSGQIAFHYDQAGRTEQAIEYYQRAAAVAQVLFSNEEVRRLLTRALELLPLLPEKIGRAQTELSILVTLGTALMSSKGDGHPEVEKTLLSAWDLCQTLGDEKLSIPILAGLWLCYHLKGDFAQEMVWVKHLQEQVQPTSNSQFHPAAYLALAGSSFYRGELRAARQYGEQIMAGYALGQNPQQIALLGYEPAISVIQCLALSLWLLGYPDQARNRMRLALELAFQTSQPSTIAATLGMSMGLHQWCGEISQTSEQAAATLGLSLEKGISQWVAHSNMLHGWARACAGQIRQGLDELQKGLQAYQATGARLALPYYLLLLAEALTLSEQFGEGLSTTQEALKILGESGERWFEAELYRRRGELLLAQGADEKEVESDFQRALEIARLQQARSLELRAAVSMSKLWQRQAKYTAARELLAEIYGCFSEGFDTADLRESKALLDSFV
jgi:DNA-binding SARP family transcriptional activator/predicted ATPase